MGIKEKIECGSGSPCTYFGKNDAPCTTCVLNKSIKNRHWPKFCTECGYEWLDKLCVKCGNDIPF